MIQRRILSCVVALLSISLFPILASGQYVVQLGWQPSTSQVAGYNVYRGGTSGGPYIKINSSLDPQTKYGDLSVQAGQTYYYVTTAVDSAGNESSYSNQTDAVIPTGGSGGEGTVYSFAGGSDPSLPYAGLIADKAGNLYGTSQLGGAYNQGTVFELARNPNGGWTESVLYTFTGGADGGQPSGGLLLDSAGNLYGTTNVGGSGNCSSGCGIVFKLAVGNWSETVVYSFAGGVDGAEPYAGLVWDSSGHLYGTTLFGGSVGACTSGCGTVFELSPAASGWTKTVLYSFASGNDGALPYAGLIFDAAGNLYGTTYAGGAFSAGTVFKLTPGSGSWHESVLHTFKGAWDGGSPYSSLIFDHSGNLYGTTFKGGGGYGVVFQLSPASNSNWKETVLHAFYNAPAASPVAGVIMDAAGSLYGTTMFGGDLGSCGAGCGTVFKLIPAATGSWTFKPLHTFGRGSDGYHPSGQLVINTDGNLYGTTQAGGPEGGGVVFEVTP